MQKDDRKHSWLLPLQVALWITHFLVTYFSVVAWKLEVDMLLGLIAVNAVLFTLILSVHYAATHYGNWNSSMPALQSSPVAHSLLFSGISGTAIMFYLDAPILSALFIAVIAYGLKELRRTGKQR